MNEGKLEFSTEMVVTGDDSLALLLASPPSAST
ncbi:MAG: malate:quinone oxidoreductase [Psychromonas sp.]|nr:malate:quinone oxidoreductase [Alteromonadales bacterium]MCP5077717.1 malate:quinone oxidoreductase [Psychromonas sp.]